MKTHVANEVGIKYSARFREYGIHVLDGGTAKQQIAFCPWCGRKLPKSLRDQWFDEIEKLGLEPDDAAIPVRLVSDRWWRD